MFSKVVEFVARVKISLPESPCPENSRVFASSRSSHVRNGHFFLPVNLEGRLQPERALLTLTFLLPFYLENTPRKARFAWERNEELTRPYAGCFFLSFLGRLWIPSCFRRARRSGVWQERPRQKGKSLAHHHTTPQQLLATSSVKVYRHYSRNFF